MIRRALPILMLLSVTLGGISFGVAEEVAPSVAVSEASAAPVIVTPAVAELLRKVQAESDPAAGLVLLAGAPAAVHHPLLTLLSGRLHLALAERGVAVDEHRSAAAREFLAVVGDPACRRNARLGLARIAADRNEWTQAVAQTALGLSIDQATADELSFYAQAAVRASDWRLAATLVGQGIMRFPGERIFRQLEIELLLRSSRFEEAREALLAQLDAEPGDSHVWRDVAWSDRSTRRDDEALAALELAVLTAPENAALVRSLTEAQLQAALPRPALATLRRLIGEPSAPTAVARADGRLVELAARAAEAAGDIALARAWLVSVPEGICTRSQRLLAARLAVEANDRAGAAGALTALIAQGEHDPAVLIWAGHLAEEIGDDARAEAFYTQASAGEGAAVPGAQLRLAGLLYRRHRFAEARTLIAIYLAKHPEDQQAKQLQDLISRVPAGSGMGPGQ